MFAPIKYAIRVKTPLISPIPINSIIEANDDRPWIRRKRESSENKEPTTPKNFWFLLSEMSLILQRTIQISRQSLYTLFNPPSTFLFASSNSFFCLPYCFVRLLNKLHPRHPCLKTWASVCRRRCIYYIVFLSLWLNPFNISTTLFIRSSTVLKSNISYIWKILILIAKWTCLSLNFFKCPKFLVIICCQLF